MSRNNVIIVAGGKGLRMGGELPKQFIPIGGKPILMHTIEAFRAFDDRMKIVLVLPSSHQEYWAELCKEYDFAVPHEIATGGDTRFILSKTDWLCRRGFVAVHDGARPFVLKKLINRCFESVENHEAVIPVIHSTDSLREVMEKGKAQ